MADVLQKSISANDIKTGTTVVYTQTLNNFQTQSGVGQIVTSTGNVDYYDHRYDDPTYYG